MIGKTPFSIALFVCASVILMAADAPSRAQTTNDRTIDEIRDESIARSERGGYPLIGLSPDDVREAFSKIKTRDGDEWAAAWISIGDKYATKARELAGPDPVQSRANLLKAWRLYAFGAWPVASTAGKQKAYQTALAAFLAASRTFDPPLEVVKIPFEDKEIVGYLRVPRDLGKPAPLVFAISGLDSRKENLIDQFAPALAEGMAIFAVDGPGTGQSPLKASPTAERVFSKAIDYLATRKEIDASRIVLHGVSFGGYWAAKLAFVERPRLKAVSVQSPAVHDTFQPDFLKKRVLGNREYLFDYLPAQIAVFEGASSLEDLVSIYPKMSLLSQELLQKPNPPMLIVGGALDTQVPISDAYRLLSAGDSPKEAWINPAGGHLGRQPKFWPDPVIFEKVILPYVVRQAKS
jgi:esterase FrsA